MDLLLSILFYVSIPVAFFIAHYQSEKRLIGYTWIWFFNIAFTFVIGGIITYCSPLLKDRKVVKGGKLSTARLLSIILILISSLLMALIFEITIEPYFDSDGVYDKNSFIDYNVIYM